MFTYYPTYFYMQKKIQCFFFMTEIEKPFWSDFVTIQFKLLRDINNAEF